MNNATKIFNATVKKELLNFKTGEMCHLVSNEKEEYFTDADYSKIVAICNQPAVYNFLFKERLGGEI